MPQIPHIQLISSALRRPWPGGARERPHPAPRRDHERELDPRGVARSVRAGGSPRAPRPCASTRGRGGLIREEAGPRDASRPSRASASRPVAAGLAERGGGTPVGLEGVGATRGCLARRLTSAPPRRRPRGCERGAAARAARAARRARARSAAVTAMTSDAAARHRAHEPSRSSRCNASRRACATRPTGRDLLLLDARVGRQPPARDRLAQRGVHPVGELLADRRGPASGTSRILYPRNWCGVGSLTLVSRSLACRALRATSRVRPRVLRGLVSLEGGGLRPRSTY